MRRKQCFFDKHNIDFIDYTNPQLLTRFTNNWAKIKPVKDTGLCAKHQRRLAQAIKRARYLALIAYTSR